MATAITPFLMFQGDGAAALDFYLAHFPESRLDQIAGQRSEERVGVGAGRAYDLAAALLMAGTKLRRAARGLPPPPPLFGGRSPSRRFAGEVGWKSPPGGAPLFGGSILACEVRSPRGPARCPRPAAVAPRPRLPSREP